MNEIANATIEEIRRMNSARQLRLFARLASIILLLGVTIMTTKLTVGAPSTTGPSYNPLVNTLQHNMGAKNRPEWCAVTGAGTLKAVNSGHFDRHYHDCNEYWMIVHGKAKVWLDGKEYYIKDGDIFCIKAGLEHDILELYEPLQGFFMEDALLPGGKAGHLHKSDEAAKGHPVPTLPVPADFPK
jgi:mannose-6-phosphate isomerase-like protein (cupin superfamily)